MDAYVVDAHSFIWFITDDPKLSKKAKHTLERAQDAQTEYCENPTRSKRSGSDWGIHGPLSLRKDEMEGFAKLEVWQKAHELVLEIYRASKQFPSAERFRLTDQLCRAAASIPANIAEGRDEADYTALYEAGGIHSST